MQAPSGRRMIWALVLLLLAIVAVTPSSMALAQALPGQTPQVPPAPQTATIDDSSSSNAAGERSAIVKLQEGGSMTPVTAAKVKYGVWGLIGGAISPRSSALSGEGGLPHARPKGWGKRRSWRRGRRSASLNS